MSHARHRAPRQLPVLPTLPGRGAAVLASSGLVLTMAATSAGATTANAPTAPVQLRAGGVELSDAARTAMSLSPVVQVAADIEWAAPAVSVSSEPAPPPPPEPVAPTTSRAGSRGAAPSSTGAAATAAPSNAPAPAVSSSAIVNYARQFLGVPYVWGGSTPSGFDCSGFTQYVYAHFGISLPRTSSAQAGAGYRVSAAEARPGDLVWWPGHVGIYTGSGNNIAARQPGTPLTEGPIYHSSPTFIRVS